ncbi:hypothetical protein ROHU_033474 [Labeo rohita]|uniref:Uncharacterized protein n=1 Tax=Labeo rohita TaxID=84645 RepID=A0A498LAQ8_LABRO|nr:hypothetical protein ROHU_033474 [Labeo rohita]
MQSGKHITFATARQHQPQINDFCTATANGEEGARPQPAEQPQTSSDIRTIFGSTPTLRAEVIWVLRTGPDSVLAQSFTCGKDKSRYVAAFGLAPYFKKELIAEVKSSGPFVVMFDESLNHTTKNKQLDLHVRFWKNNHVQSRFYGSQFLGHATAQDLLHHFKEFVQDLDLRNMISVSMDGPNVNWKLFEHLQQEHAEAFGGSQLIVVVTQKNLPNPRTSSYDCLAVARNDPLIMAKFHFFMALSRTFTPFLTKYQTDEPVLPFISQDLTVLIKSLLKRFIKSEVLHNITPLQLVKLDTGDMAARIQLKNVDIGLGAEAVLKVM